jgi:anti-sigma B factor antagonist
MTLHIASREVDGVTVLALNGRVVLGEESSTLREKVKDLLAAGKKKIVLNMDKLDYIDSSGVGMLVAVFHTAKSRGASLVLCQLGSHFQEMLQITKLLTVFDTYRTEADALRSLAK